MFLYDPPTSERKVVTARSEVVLALVLVGLIAAFVISVSILVRADHERTVDESNQQISHIAELIEKSVESSLDITNLQMRNMLEQIVQSAFDVKTLANNFYTPLLIDTIEEIEQIDSLVLIDMAGNVLWTSVPSMQGVNLSDRGYFGKALTLGQGQYAVGVPVLSRGTGRRLTPIAWPIIGPNAEIYGVAASGLGEGYFEDLLSANGVQSDVRINIVTENGDVAFSVPNIPADTSDQFISASKDIPGLGLQVIVSRALSDVLEGQIQRSIVFVSVATILFVAALSLALHSQLKSFKLADGLHRAERDKKRIESAQAEFNAIFQNVADGIVVFGVNEVLEKVNAKALNILGVTTQSAAVTKLRQLLPPLTELTAEPMTLKFELVRDNKGSEERTIQARIMSLQLGNMDLVYCVLSDVTDEERLTLARENFITSINHELRTPLTSLTGALDILKGRFTAQMPEGATKLLEMALRNSDRLLLLVNDILTLQAIDQHQLHLKIQKLNVNDVLAEALSTNAGFGMGMNVSVSLEAIEHSATLKADPVRLQQIFSNIISNAVKYTPKGGEVKIGASVADDIISFWVRDDGPGIPESARAQLFERFSVPVHERSIQASGTGLGLAITQELAERQGGNVSFKSRLIEDDPIDHGTTFFVTFPATANTQTING